MDKPPESERPTTSLPATEQRGEASNRADLSQLPALPASTHEPPVTRVTDSQGSGFDIPPRSLGSTNVELLASGQGGLLPPGYEIVGELGSGGMGVVYRALQLKANRLVALKMFRAGAHAHRSEIARFQIEAEALARLQHPHIVQVYEVGEWQPEEGGPPLPFFSLEYCPGGSLDRKLQAGLFSATEAARLVETLARAMHAAHQAQVIHRDLKPANVLLLEDGTPKITDFGLAKKLDDGSGQTQSGMIVGTPNYMAPEQASGHSRDIGPGADIYALGAILYECLTGRPPFLAATPLDTIRLVVETEPLRPSQLQSNTPVDLETICLKCLHKAPGQRYASAAALADDLERFQRGEPIVARPVGNLERGWRWCKRNPALASSLAAVAGSLLLGALVAVGFAVQAQHAEEKADERASAAERAKEETGQARDELLQANLRLRTDKARSLLLPLAPGALVNNPQMRLSDPEIDALWQLATAPDEGLGLLFVKEALGSSGTLRQLADRAEVALQAAIGLNPERRSQVEQLLGERLQAPDCSREDGERLGMILAALDVQNRTLAEKAVAALLASMGRSTDRAVARERLLSLRSLAAQHEPEQAMVILTQAKKRTRDDEFLRSLTIAWETQATRLKPVQAATTILQAMLASEREVVVLGLGRELPSVLHRLEQREVTAFAETLAQALKQAREERVKESLARGLAVLSTRLQLSKAATMNTEALKGATEPTVVRILSETVAQVAQGLDAQEAATLCRPVAVSLLQAMRAKNVGWQCTAHASGLAALTRWLPKDEEALLCGQGADLLSDDMQKVPLYSSLPEQAETLALLATRMKPSEAAVVCARGATSLVQAFGKWAVNPGEQRLAQGLIALASHLEPSEALRHMTKAMSVAITPLAMPVLRDGMVALTARMEPKQAVAVLFEIMGQPSSERRVPTLASITLKIADRLEPPEAAQVCDKAAALLLEAIDKHKLSQGLLPVVQQLTELTGRLPAPRGQDVTRRAATVLTRMSDTTSTLALSGVVQSLSTLVVRLEPKEAAQLCTPIATTLVDRLKNVTGPSEMNTLSRGLAILALRLEPKEALRCCDQAVSLLLARLERETDETNLTLLAEGLADVVQRVEPLRTSRAAAQALQRLTQAMHKSNYVNRWVMLSRGMLALAVRMQPEEVPPLLQSMRTTTKPIVLSVLAQAVALVARRMKPEDAAQVCGQATSLLLQAMSQTTAPRELVRGLAAVAVGLEPKEAVAVLSQSMNALTISNDLIPLAQALATLAPRLEPAEAAVAAATVAQALNRSMGDADAQTLTAILAILNVRQTPEGTAQTASLLVEAVRGSTDIYVSYYLSESLRSVLSRVEWATMPQRSAHAAGAVGSLACTSLPAFALRVAHPALQPLPPPLPVPALVELLKQPLCVGMARRQVLQQLERHYGRPFADQWAFVNYARQHNLGLDLTTPPLRHRKPEAERRRTP